MKESDLERAFRFQLNALKIPFEQEVQLTSTRRWRFDFTFDGRLAVELEGGTWVAGRHNRGAGFQADVEKYNRATALGWRVLRFTAADVESGRALSEVEAALAGTTVPRTGPGPVYHPRQRRKERTWPKRQR